MKRAGGTRRKRCIQGGTVVLPDECVSDGTVVFAGERIEYAGPRMKTPSGAEVIDARRHVVSPGLIDLHIHGAGRIAFEGLDGARFEEASRTLERRGVLRFLPTTMANEDVIGQMAAALSAASASGVCPGIYVEGPFVSMEKRGGIQKSYVRGVDLSYLRRLQRLAGGRPRRMRSQS